MSKIENVRTHSKDIYSVCKESVENFYSNIEKSLPQFHQATISLFQEYVKSWNNAMVSIIDIQKEYATKAGIKSNLPEATMKIMHDTTEDLNKSFGVQNKISIASIDATKQNIKTWNDHSNTFTDLNKNIVDSLVSTINPKA